MEISIKTSLFYLYGEQLDELKESINGLFETTNFENISDALVYSVKEDFTLDISSKLENDLPVKHQKTFLLYLSEVEHKKVNDYINSFLPNKVEAIAKKQLRTEVVKQLLDNLQKI